MFSSSCLQSQPAVFAATLQLGSVSKSILWRGVNIGTTKCFPLSSCWADGSVSNTVPSRPSCFEGLRDWQEIKITLKITSKYIG